MRQHPDESVQIPCTMGEDGKAQIRAYKSQIKNVYLEQHKVAWGGECEIERTTENLASICSEGYGTEPAGQGLVRATKATLGRDASRDCRRESYADIGAGAGSI